MTPFDYELMKFTATFVVIVTGVFVVIKKLTS